MTSTWLLREDLIRACDNDGFFIFALISAVASSFFKNVL